MKIIKIRYIDFKFRYIIAIHYKETTFYINIISPLKRIPDIELSMYSNAERPSIIIDHPDKEIDISDAEFPILWVNDLEEPILIWESKTCFYTCHSFIKNNEIDVHFEKIDWYKFETMADDILRHTNQDIQTGKS